MRKVLIANRGERGQDRPRVPGRRPGERGRCTAPLSPTRRGRVANPERSVTDHLAATRVTEFRQTVRQHLLQAIGQSLLSRNSLTALTCYFTLLTPRDRTYLGQITRTSRGATRIHRERPQQKRKEEVWVVGFY